MEQEEVFEVYYKERDKFIIKSLSKLKQEKKLVLRYSSPLMRRIQDDIYNSIYQILNNKLIEGVDFICEKEIVLNELMFEFCHAIEIKRLDKFEHIFEMYKNKTARNN